MNLHPGLVAGDGGINLQHMSAQDSLMALAQVEGVVLHKDGAVIVSHDLQQAGQSCVLPVTLGAEAIALSHEELGCQARQLLEALEVLEVGAESGVAPVIQEFLDAEIFPQLILHGFGELLRSIVLGSQVILVAEFLIAAVNILFADSIDDLYQVAHRPIIHRPAQLDLGLHLVALGDSHIAHGVAEAADLQLEALIVGHSHILPAGNLGLHFLIAPETVDNLVLEVQAGVQVSVLAVAMSALIEVHIVKVDSVIGNILTVLGSQMQERLLQQHRAANPVLGRREGVHPGDDTSHFLVIVHILHELGDAVSGGHDPFAHYLVGQLAALIELLDNVFRITGHILQLLLTIEELAAGHKPKFIVRYIKHGKNSFAKLSYSNGHCYGLTRRSLITCFTPQYAVQPPAPAPAPLYRPAGRH